MIPGLDAIASGLFYCHLYRHTMQSDLTIICAIRQQMLTCEKWLNNYDGPMFTPVGDCQAQQVLRHYDDLTRTLHHVESRQLDRDFPTDVPF